MLIQPCSSSDELAVAEDQYFLGIMIRNLGQHRIRAFEEIIPRLGARCWRRRRIDPVTEMPLTQSDSSRTISVLDFCQLELGQSCVST